MKKETGMFADFVNKVCDNDGERVLRMKTAIGYLVSGKKSPSYAKMVLFGNKHENTFANGKSLVSRAVGKFVESHCVETMHKKFDRFMFQEVKESTRVVIADDIVGNNNVRNLAIISSCDMQIDRMMKDAVVIPLESSPMFLGIFDGCVPMFDAVVERRIEVVEFGNYFHSNHSPVDEYDCMFFEDWSNLESGKWVAFMCDCVRLFKEYGLITKKKG